VVRFRRVPCGARSVGLPLDVAVTLQPTIPGAKGVFPEGKVNVSQNLTSLYISNSRVYVMHHCVVMERGEISGADSRGVVMPLEASADIDEPVDFLGAEAILMAGRHFPK